MEAESQQPKEKEKEVRPLASKLNIPSVICTTCDIQGNVTFGKGMNLRIQIFCNFNKKSLMQI